MTIPQALQLAVQHHQAGRLADAEAIYRQILAVDPRHADALHLLGVLAHQAGHSDAALDLLKQARALLPNHPEIRSNLGEVYRKLGYPNEAIAELRQALEIQPDYAEALSNLGNALADRGLTDEAIEAFRQALQLKPEIAETHYNLGNVLSGLGRHDEAVHAYRRTLEFQPSHAAACNNLGNALSKQERIDEAITTYRRAIVLQPDFSEAHFNLGNALKDQDRLTEAVAAYRRAIELQPDYADAHRNLGSVLALQGHFDEAIDMDRQALELDPTSAEVHNNLGNALAQRGRLDEAIGAYRQALRFKPAFVEAHNNLGNALSQQRRFDEAIASFRRTIELRPGFAEAHNNLGNALSQQGRFDAAITSFRRAIELRPTFAEAHNNLGGVLPHLGRYKEGLACFRTALELDPDLVLAHSNLLNCLRYPGELDGEAMFREHCRWDEVHARPLMESFERCANDPNPDRRLRVGYVSPDFRSHSVAFFLEKLLDSHNREEVEIFCYADLLRADAVTERLRQQAGHWRELTGMNDALAAELIRKDRIDILVDLAGHTAGNRLLVFARRPAPVQVTWLGYWDTTGMRAMDYRLTDAHADPPGASEHLHTEQLVRLPETFACFRPWEAAPPVSSLPALDRGIVTFASFHTLPKINERLLEYWVRILQRVPGSRLIMASAGLEEVSCWQRFSEFFSQRGIASERLIFKGRVPLAEYLALHHEADVLLDSHPFSGHTVSCHALWMGLPVVTLAGKLHCSRMVASVLTNVGLPELIAHTPEEYVEIAAALAADLPRLAALRASLRERMATSPLTDGPRFARHVEAVYRQIWQTWCDQQSVLSPS